MNQLARTVIAPLALCLTLLAGVSSATASSTGGFTQAVADPAWTTGRISGEASWAKCSVKSPGKCSWWRPFVMIQPALPSYRCSWEYAWDSGGDRNIRVLWAGKSQSAPGGKQTFDIPDASLLAGVQGQRACLVALTPVEVPDQLCIAQNEVFIGMGLPPIKCGLVQRITGEVIAESLLTEERKNEPRPTPRMTRREAMIVAKGRLARKYGRSWKRGKAKRVNCREMTRLFNCKATWKTKVKRGKKVRWKKRRGSVTVRK